MKDLQRNLVAYGTHLLASQLGQEWPPSSPSLTSGSLAEAILRTSSYLQDERLRLARKIVRDTSLEAGLEPLLQAQPVTPVFSLLTRPPGVPSHDRDPPPLAALSIPSPRNDDLASDQELPISPLALWGEFWEALNRLSAQGEFDTFVYLMTRYGWNAPGTIADPRSPNFEHGLSVFEQFKAVAALSRCLDPALGDDDQPIGLVAGDLPGIQRVLYTITAKGAAKTLRGHSAYLQLLSDALVRLLLRHFDLSWANVVFSAGGNFLVVTPGDALEKIDGWRDDVNEKLLALHRGELYLALAGIAIPVRLYADGSAITEHGSLAEKRTELQRRLEAAKQSAFARLAPAHYDDVFGQIGDGGGADLCEVCHVEVDERTQVFKPEEYGEGELLLCEQCHSFAYKMDQDDADFKYDSLAWSVANANRMLISPLTEAPSLKKYRQGKGNPPWNVALRVLGLDYQFLEPGDPIPLGTGTLLAFDPAGFLPESPEMERGYGFRFLSQLTPRETPYDKQIRDFGSMAQEDAIGIPRYGVLRMDVDSLGQTMSGKGMTYPDLLHISALSNALDYFFGGMLDQVGRDCVDEWQKQTAGWSKKVVDVAHKWPYVIYAGGDDMFVVAPWDLLPPLAQAIQKEFSKFCWNRLTVSGGIAIAREKYPLYRAAEQAGLALDQSKDRVVEDKSTMLITARKDALTFLGVTLSWKDVATARDLAKRLANMLSGHPDGDKAPRALLQLLYYVARLYRREAGLAETDSVKLGQWLPALHYGLRRMQRRVPESLKPQLAAIPNDILDLDSVQVAGERLQALQGTPQEDVQKESAEDDLRQAIRAQLRQTRQGWPAIRYLGLPVRWAEFLTRKED